MFLVLVLTFSLQSWTKADDISEFEIEGMSIGDSALKFFSEKDIKNNSRNYFKKKDYTPVENSNYSFFETYDYVDFSFKTGDPKYIIVRLSGAISFKNNVEKCYDKLNEIVEEISSVIGLEKPDIQTIDFFGDSTGKSKQTGAIFYLQSGAIDINCYDYSNEYGGEDHLALRIITQDYIKFLNSNPYE